MHFIYVTLWRHYDVNSARKKIGNIFFFFFFFKAYMFPHENEYKSLLPQNAYGSPNFDKAACTITQNELFGHKTTDLPPQMTTLRTDIP